MQKSYLFLKITFFVLIAFQVWGCTSNETEEGNITALVGEWKLEDISVDWLDQACAVLDFPENEVPKFEFIQLNEDELVLRFNNEAHTSWRGKIHRKVFDATQVQPTTDRGSTCGDYTPVRILIRYNPNAPDQIEGTWQTPNCSYCPDRVFDALRVLEE